MLPLLKLPRYIVYKNKYNTYINDNTCAYSVYKEGHCAHAISHCNKIVHTLDTFVSTLSMSIPWLKYKICYYLNKSRNKINRIVEKTTDRTLDLYPDQYSYKIIYLKENVEHSNQSWYGDETFSSIDISYTHYYLNNKLFSTMIKCIKNYFPQRYADMCSEDIWRAKIVYYEQSIYNITLYLCQTDEIKIYEHI